MAELHARQERDCEDSLRMHEESRRMHEENSRIMQQQQQSQNLLLELFTRMHPALGSAPIVPPPYAGECCNWIRHEWISHVRVQWQTSGTAPRASLVSTSPQFHQCCFHSTLAADVAVTGYCCCTRRRRHRGCTARPTTVLAAQRKCRGCLSTVRGGK